MNIVECDGCGGALVFDAQHEAVRCPFCAGVTLRASELRDVEIPTHAAIRKLDESAARALFRTWARRSWWTPKALRDLEVELQPLWVPAWCIDAKLDVTWTGLDKANTRSGKRPRSGTDRLTSRQWIPASMGLSLDELRALTPARDTATEVWKARDETFEVSGLSRRGAVTRARTLFVESARATVVRNERVSDARVSIVLDEVHARALMLPVYIGCFRFRERPWRFVINAQTAAVCGRTPVDRKKVVVLSITMLIVASLAWAWFSSSALA